MDDSEYLSRINKQIKYYDEHSKTNKKWYIILKILSILFILLASFSSVVNVNYLWIKFLFYAFSIIAVFFISIIDSLKIKEKWMNYRYMSGLLKSNLCLYKTKTAPYNNENRLNLLVCNCESVLLKERKDWFHVMETANQDKSNKK